MATRRRISSSSEFNVVVCGPGAVGKSCLSMQFIKNIFLSEYDPTIEDCYQRQMEVDNKICIVDIKDTAGQEDYSVMLDHGLRNGDAFILVFDVTSVSSFEEVQSFYSSIQRCNESNPNSPIIILVGNKVDMKVDRKVSTEEAEALAAKLGASYFEASAKLRLNVDEIFIDAVRRVRRQRDEAQLEEVPKKKKRRNLLSRLFRKLGRRSSKRVA